MSFIVPLIIVTIALEKVQGQNVESIRHIPHNSSYLLSHSGLQRYVIKDVILYLTPSQIRALQEGKDPQISNVKQIQEQLQAFEQVQNQERHLQPRQHENTQLRPVHHQQLQTQAILEHQPYSFLPHSSPAEYRQPESIPHNTFQPANAKRFLKPIPFFPDPSKEAANELKPVPPRTPQEPIQEKDEQIDPQQLKEQWLQLLHQNIAEFKTLQIMSQDQKENLNENKLNFQYTIPQNDNSNNEEKYAAEILNAIRSSTEQQLQLENQQALLQAEAIANSQPILVQKEISLKQTPSNLITHVSVPVPTPVFVPVPETYNVNVPRTYAVPLDLLRTLSLSVIKAQANELDRPLAIESDRRIPLPMTQNVLVDRPVYVDQLIPLNNLASQQGSFSIYRHQWKR